MSLLATKLYVPALRAHLVERAGLVERLQEGLRQGHRLTLVSAPAGFGKTTLISEWQHSRQGADRCAQFTWLSLDENDNDPVRFLTYVLAAMQRIDPNIGQTATAMLGAGRLPPAEALLSSLVNDLTATPQPFALVLDDYHLIQTASIHEQVGFLVAHQPPQLHLVIVTREDPPLPLARLRARGQLTDIRQRDLQFTEAETAGFLLGTMALELSPADIATLRRRTEGWIAGLQLAALSMQQADDVRRFVADLDGSQRYILDYLVDEVFERQTPEVQEFLLKTSILDRLTAGLCDAVTGRDDGRQALPALDHANLFLVRLDESRQWYRYHHLFRDLLRSQSQGLDRAALHMRAARWYAQNGFPEEAMSHALEAEDWDEAERLMDQAAPHAMNNGQFATLARWLDALPEERLRSTADLAAVKGWTLLSQRRVDAAGAWAEMAQSLLVPGASRTSQVLVVCLQTYLAQARLELPRVIELANRALALLKEGDIGGLRGAALTNLASAQAAMGDIRAATETCRELAHLGLEKGLPISAVSALTRLASFELLQGRAAEAVILGQRALALSVDARGVPTPLAGQAHIALGLIYYDLDELAQAREHLARGLETSRQLGTGSSTIEAAFALAWIEHMAGEKEAARATIRDAQQAAAQLNLAHFDVFLSAIQAGWELKRGNLEAAARWAERSGLSPDDTPTFLREAEYVAYGRVLVAQRRCVEAQVLLAKLEGYARSGGFARCLITVCLLQAVALAAAGEKGRAVARLEEAVRLAAPGGYGRAFLDEGAEVLALLPGARHAAPEFVDRLLGRGGAEALSPLAQAGEAERRGAQALVEPLSEREREVLRLLAEGLSNQEIGSRLFISVGTVKTHVHNICGKMAAGSRGQAVARAREWGMV